MLKLANILDSIRHSLILTKSNMSPTTILDLDKDCIEIITTYLNNKDIIAFGTSCRELNKLLFLKINKINLDHLEKQVKSLNNNNIELKERILDLEAANSFQEKQLNMQKHIRNRGRSSRRSRSPNGKRIRKPSPRRFK